MNITLNKNWSLDELKEVISSKYPNVKKANGYLKVDHNGIKLTVYPKANNVLSINRDVPVLKSILLIAVIFIVLGGIATLVAPQLLGKSNKLLILVGAVVFVVFERSFFKKGESAINEFCDDLKAMIDKTE